MKTLSAVVPCYNESRALPALVNRFAQALGQSSLGADAFELVLVENGSTDDSATVLQDLRRRAEYSFMRVAQVSVNQGYGHGMLEGLRAAAGDVVATSHADLQCDPRDLFRAYDLYRTTPERPLIVKGVRHGRALSAVAISRGMELAALLLLQTRLHEINAQPKVFDRQLVRALVDAPLDFGFDLYLLLKAKELGYAIRPVDVVFPARPYGHSHWAHSFRSRLRTMLGVVRYMAAYRWS